MSSLSSQYEKLVRLREKRARLQRHITQLENKLQGKKYRFGGASWWKNKR